MVLHISVKKNKHWDGFSAGNLDFTRIFIYKKTGIVGRQICLISFWQFTAGTDLKQIVVWKKLLYCFLYVAMLL